MKTEPKKQLRSVKHVYSPGERQGIGDELARQVGNLRSIESEFDQVKAGFKARSASAEALVHQLSQALTSGFEFRNKPCLVVIHPPTKRRYVYLEEEWSLGGTPDPTQQVDRDAALFVEDMTPDDFQQELPGVEKEGAK